MGKETVFLMPEGPGSGGVESGIHKGNVATLEKPPQKLFQEGGSGSGPGGPVGSGSGLGSGPGGPLGGGNEGAGGISGSTHEAQTSPPEIEIENLHEATPRIEPSSPQPDPEDRGAPPVDIASSGESPTPPEERSTTDPDLMTGHDPVEHLDDAHRDSIEHQVHEDASVREAIKNVKGNNSPENRRILYDAIRHKVGHTVRHKAQDMRHAMTPENIVKKTAKTAAVASLISLVIILGIMKSFKEVS